MTPRLRQNPGQQWAKLGIAANLMVTPASHADPGATTGRFDDRLLSVSRLLSKVPPLPWVSAWREGSVSPFAMTNSRAGSRVNQQEIGKENTSGDQCYPNQVVSI
jgi:hypothetical protein